MEGAPATGIPPANGRTTVLGLGLEGLSLVPGQGTVEGFVEPLERDDGEPLVERLAGLLEGERHVLAIHPGWFAPAARLRVEMADVILERPRFALHETDLPPLAGAVLAALAAALPAHLGSLGLVHAALPALEAELHHFAWLGSVRGLSEPAPALTQHVASWWPGSEFAASSWPEPAVRRLTKAERGVPVPELPGPAGLVYARQQAEAGWVTGVLASDLGLEAVEVAPTAHGPTWWGTDKLVEAVAYPSDPAALATRLAEGLDARPCRWCGELVAAEPCPFCGVTDHAEPDPAPA